MNELVVTEKTNTRPFNQTEKLLSCALRTYKYGVLPLYFRFITIRKKYIQLN